MPPVAQPGSRAGLITALVIFVLGTFIAGSLAVYNYVELGKKEIETKAAVDKANKFTNSGDQDALLDVQRRATEQKKTVARVLMEDADGLAQVITGQTGQPPVKVREQGDAGRAAAAYWKQQAALPEGQTPATLLAAIDDLGNALKSNYTEAEKLKKEIAAAQDAKTAVDDKYKADVKQRDDAVTAKDAEIAKVRTEIQTYQTTKDKAIEDDKAAQAKQITDLGEQSHKLTLQIAEKQQALDSATKRVTALEQLLKGRRLDPRVSLLRNIDGKITRITGGSTVWIDLGYGDQMSPGITFEVYDRDEGIPKGSSEVAVEEQLPAGKASIEVISVGQNSSECRIIRKARDVNINEGDVIANLVYDRNVKFAFYVYAGAGFDLSQSGRTGPQGGDVLKGLITRWGGKVIDWDPGSGRKMPIEVDFVILGKEPVVPKFDNPDANQKYLIEKAEKDLKQYDSVREQAAELCVPIMNQNRFLYFIGYFEMARRQAQ